MSTANHEIEQPLKGGMLFLAAIVLASANFIAVLDMTIANVSVPNIAGSLGISSSQGTWVITSYAVAEAIIVPLTGWIAGRFGSVRVFTTAMLLFGAFSAFCGIAQTLEMLVFGRIMQGLSGGLAARALAPAAAAAAHAPQHGMRTATSVTSKAATRKAPSATRPARKAASNATTTAT